MSKTLDEKKAISKWVEKLSSESMPLFAHTARNIASLSTDDETSISEMSQSILSDSSMTARVLRMANSVHYNPSLTPINTVSRAIVILGFDCVKNIALSISLIDTVLSGIRHDRAIEEMIRAYHSAIQARNIAIMDGVGNEEEIFIAALLRRIGQLTFWCFSYGQAEALDFEYSMAKNSEEAEKSVLGFALSDLTETLAHKWHLGELLEECTSEPVSECSNKGAIVEYGYDLALASEHGWTSEETKDAIDNVCKVVDRTTEEVRNLSYQSAKEATDALKVLGIPDPEKVIPEVKLKQEKEAEKEKAQAATIDKNLDMQMSMFREISSMVFNGCDINVTLSTVLEGIYRGLEMDRTIFALVAAKEQRIRAKFVMGGHKDIMMERFDFTLQPSKDNVINTILKSGKPTHIDHRYRFVNNALYTKKIKMCFGENDAFAMPIYIGNTPKAIVYADRCVSKRPLTESDFQMFVHFCEHINIAFKMLNK